MAPLHNSLALLLLGALFFFSAAPADAAFFLRPRFFADVVRCADTTWSTSGAGTCGGDSLTTGVGSSIALNSFSGSASVSLKGASVLNLYEVAYLPVGLPAASAITLGQVCTVRVRVFICVCAAAAVCCCCCRFCGWDHGFAFSALCCLLCCFRRLVCAAGVRRRRCTF
jgi:hypothetical protein